VQRLGGDAGLTLVEMMVALAIIGVMAGVAVLGVGAVDRTVGVEVEARRLAAALSLAADRATMDRHARVFSWDDDGYAVAVPRAPTTIDAAPSADQDAAARHELSAGLRLTVDRGEDALAVAPDGVGAPFEATLSGGVDRWRVSFDGLRATAAPLGRSD